MQKLFEQDPQKLFIGFITIPYNSVRLNYSLATSAYLSEIEGFDFDLALKLRPYVGIIGIDNSSVDKYLKISKVLCLHAILHDEMYNQGPGYSYRLPWKNSNCFSKHLSGILFCLYIKVFHPSIFSFIGMLSSKTFVLDVEGFRHRKEKFIVKKNLVFAPTTILTACHFYLQQFTVC